MQARRKRGRQRGGLGRALGLPLNPIQTRFLVAAGVGAVVLLFAKRALAAIRRGSPQGGPEGFVPVDERALRAASPPAAAPYIGAVVVAARQYNVPASVLVAIGERESRWGNALTPRGPAGKGDSGHGHGFMQIDDRSFPEFTSSARWADPAQNIDMGAQVLDRKRRYLAATPRTPTVTLSDFEARRRGVPPGVYPDKRPLAGAELLRAAIAAYNTGELNVLRSLGAGVDVDTTTAGSQKSGGRGDYSAWVLSLANEIEGRMRAAGSYV